MVLLSGRSSILWWRVSSLARRQYFKVSFTKEPKKSTVHRFTLDSLSNYIALYSMTTALTEELPQDTTNPLSTIFRFCAQSMHYPEKNWLTQEYYTGLFQLLKELGAESEKEVINATITNSVDFLEELQIEHTRLFINSTPHVIAPPYGSVYRNHSLAGKYAEDIHLFYREQGYDIPEHGDFPDSLIHQLEFLSFITKEKQKSIRKRFLLRFFSPWFGEFSTRVRAEAKLPFYPVIISLIDFFTKEEEEYGV